ncbi:MAG: FUSC family protein, partial [Aestuariivirgaceae bacterium]|nr:FUSC family protein [Aestuariivirgaceae bacterium]
MRILSLKTRFSAQIQLAFRVAIAAGLAFWIADALQLPQGFWAVITAVMVMQASLGASLQAALDRLMGTLAGAAWGGLVAVIMAPASTGAHLLAIAIALIPLAFLAALNPAFRVAPITALIVMLPNPFVSLPPLEAALDRVLEIALGNAVGITVSLLILPARAQGAMAHAAARICDLNAELMKAHF